MNIFIAFSGLALLIGHQEEHLARGEVLAKPGIVICLVQSADDLHCSPANANACQFLLYYNPEWLPFCCWLTQVVLEEALIWVCLSVMAMFNVDKDMDDVCET